MVTNGGARVLKQYKHEMVFAIVTELYCSVFLCGRGGIVVRRRADFPSVVGSKPALATFEESILGQGVNTNCAFLHPGVKWVPDP